MTTAADLVTDANASVARRNPSDLAQRDQLLADGNEAPVEVDILPTEPQRLATSAARRSENREVVSRDCRARGLDAPKS